MFRYVFVLLFTGLMASVVCAELQPVPTSVEQLKANLTELTDSNINKLAIYTELVKQTRRSSPEQALEYAKLGLALHQRHSWPGQKALLLGYVTKIHLERRQLKLAESLIEQGLEFSHLGQDAEALSVNLFNQALLYQLRNQLVLAINSYQKLEALYKETGDVKQLAATFNNIGIIHFKLGNFDDALKSYQLAVPLYQEAQNPVHHANTVMNIGEVFYLIKDFRQARENYLVGLSMINENLAPLSFVEGQQRLGMLYQELGLFDLALNHFNIAMEVAQSNALNGSQIALNFELIKLAAETKNNLLLEQSLANAQSLLLADEQGEQSISMNYFRAFVAAEKKDWQSAEKSIDKLFDNPLYEPRYFILQDALTLAFEIKSQLGKAGQANAMILQSFEHYKAQQKQSRDSQLSQYAQLYKIKQKEHQLINLQQQSALQENEKLKAEQNSRLMLFVFIIVCLVLVMLIVVSWLKARGLRRENQLSNELMEQKKQFFADISHELRTPLTVFKLKMEELEYDIADDPKTVYKLLHERIDSFNALIKDISLLAQNDKGELELMLEDVELVSFFQQAGEELQILATKHNLQVKFDMRLSEGLVAQFDRARVRQVLMNLFSNACRYTASPGQIVFTVKQQQNQLCWRIEDSSPGLEPEQCEKIFNRLYRADKSRSRKLGGSGLGLSICRDLVGAHKGRIRAKQSQLGGIKVSTDIPLRQR